MLSDYEPDLARKVVLHRGEVIIEGLFAYLLRKKAIWVKRVEASLFRDGGRSVFDIPYEKGR